MQIVIRYIYSSRSFGFLAYPEDDGEQDQDYLGAHFGQLHFS